MKNSTKQVIILDNFTSPYIHQAILILKNYDPSMEQKILAEAEQIVSGYFPSAQPVRQATKKTSIFPWLISALSIICAVAFCVLAQTS